MGASVGPWQEANETLEAAYEKTFMDAQRATAMDAQLAAANTELAAAKGAGGGKAAASAGAASAAAAAAAPDLYGAQMPQENVVSELRTELQEAKASAAAWEQQVPHCLLIVYFAIFQGTANGGRQLLSNRRRTGSFPLCNDCVANLIVYLLVGSDSKSIDRHLRYPGKLRSTCTPSPSHQAWYLTIC